MKKTKNVIGNKVTINHFENGSTFRVGSIGVEPFSIPHDAADPSAFIFQNEKQEARACHRYRVRHRSFEK